MGQTRWSLIPHHVPSPCRSSIPSSTCPSFATTHIATFLHGSCPSQNTNNFNTLVHCWKTTVKLLWNRRPHPNRAHNQPPHPLGMFFPNILPTRPQPAKVTWTSPCLGPSPQKAEQMLMAKLQTVTRGSHNTNKQKGSHCWHRLLPARATGRAFLYRTETAFPVHITTTKPYFCSTLSSKPT